MTEPVQTEKIYTEINTVDHFADLMDGWLRTVLGKLNNFEAIPEGSLMEYDGKEITLEGDVLHAFKFALGLAKGELATFPIVFEQVEATETTA